MTLILVVPSRVFPLIFKGYSGVLLLSGRGTTIANLQIHTSLRFKYGINHVIHGKKLDITLIKKWSKNIKYTK